jgi:hypothetical protein
MGLLIASLAAMTPGFYFRQHYFILVLPAAALLAGVTVASIQRLLRSLVSGGTAPVLAGACLLLAMGAYISNERAYLFSMSPRDLSRTVYGANPFVEAPEIARYIHDRTGSDDRIAVIGSEPEIYFYARRKSATGHIYTYGLMEPQKYASQMQDEMMREIEAARPRYAVFAGISTSWLARTTSDRRILTWTDKYLQQCYEQVGVADIESLDKTTMRWDAEAAGYQPRADNIVYTFRRRTDAPCPVAP